MSTDLSGKSLETYNAVKKAGKKGIGADDLMSQLTTDHRNPLPRGTLAPRLKVLKDSGYIDTKPDPTNARKVLYFAV